VYSDKYSKQIIFFFQKRKCKEKKGKTKKILQKIKKKNGDK